MQYRKKKIMNEEKNNSKLLVESLADMFKDIDEINDENIKDAILNLQNQKVNNDYQNEEDNIKRF